jgi:carbon-monoxide dehydrogenase medium subunit
VTEVLPLKEIDYAAPKTIAEAVNLLSEKGDRARILAGGTDIIVQVREHRRDLDLLLDIKHIPEVNELAYDTRQGLRIGAAVPCYRIYEDAGIAKTFPGLIDAVSLIGGVQIQSRASVGGNLCNASPAADTIPALIAHQAVCVIVGPHSVRELPVEQFCTAPGRTALQRGELLLRLRLRPPPPRFGAAYLRFIPRNEMDIAVVGAGVSTAARPISDMRGDADYRRHLVGVLVKRALQTAVARAKGP